MKILIGYLPLKSKKGIPTLGQNRQFQYFTNPTLIFPVVPASATTLLKAKGYDVLWKDCVAEEWDYDLFVKYLEKEKPELVAFETKTPVIRRHWEIVNSLKEKFKDIDFVIMGDHVTVFPDETLKNSKIDYVLTGGDYDFSLLGLVDYLSGKKKKLPAGIYYHKGGKIVNSGKFKLTHNLDELPFIDRDMTKCFKYYQKEYNLVGKPFAYIMSARDCWWGKCAFCIWPHSLYPSFRTRSVESVLDEIGMLIEKYNVKEIFDDAGTLPVGIWLKNFCKGMINRGYNKKVKFSCNMRFGVLKQEDYNLMKKAGFRLLKYGLESGNQYTLDKLNKGVKINDIIEGCKMAYKAGLTVHLTMIVGYPWETKEKALNTFGLAKRLMQSGVAHVLQATVLVPYPGTPLWKDAIKNNWFLFDPLDYERYDMGEPVLKTKDSDSKDIAKISGKIYTIFLTPKYVYHRLKNIKSMEDIKFNLLGAKAVFGHLNDFLFKKK
jgi:anaerobic magnesium-protoporphyrin IX monomethyl ester cyclase